MARNWSTGPDWVPGTLVEKLGPLTFMVRTEFGQLWKRHMDHLRGLGDKPLSSDSMVIPTNTNVSINTRTNATQGDTEELSPPMDRLKRYLQRDHKEPERLVVKLIDTICSYNV